MWLTGRRCSCLFWVFLIFGFVSSLALQDEKEKEWRLLRLKNLHLILGTSTEMHPSCFAEMSGKRAARNCRYKPFGEHGHLCCQVKSRSSKISREICNDNINYPLDTRCDCGLQSCSHNRIIINTVQSAHRKTTTTTTTTMTPTTTTTTTAPTITTTTASKPTTVATKVTKPKRTTTKRTKRPTITKSRKTTINTISKSYPTRSPQTTTALTIPTQKPAKALKCFSCESVQGDPTGNINCKDNPKSTKIIICQPGQHCRTVTYVSAARKGSVIIRGCVNPGDETQLSRSGKVKSKREVCLKNPLYLPSPCEEDQADCKYTSCDCHCDRDLCNNLIYPGDGWGACGV